MRATTSRRIIFYEWLGFGSIVILLWVDELFDLPHLIFGSPATPINIKESLLETSLVVALAIVDTLLTKRWLSRLKHLEGRIRVCGVCHRVREGNTWVSMESYIAHHSDAEMLHGLTACPGCIAKHLPDGAHENRKSVV